MSSRSVELNYCIMFVFLIETVRIYYVNFINLSVPRNTDNGDSTMATTVQQPRCRRDTDTRQRAVADFKAGTLREPCWRRTCTPRCCDDIMIMMIVKVWFRQVRVRPAVHEKSYVSVLFVLSFSLLISMGLSPAYTG